MNVLVPLDGNGDWFIDNPGYTTPWPLIRPDGEKSLVELMVENLSGLVDGAKFYFVVNKRYDDEFNISRHLKDLGTVILRTGGQGRVDSCLLASVHINNGFPLLICEGNGFFHLDASRMLGADLGGMVAVEKVRRGGNVSLDPNGRVDCIGEREGRLASVGIFLWKHGSDFVSYASGKGSLEEVFHDAVMGGLDASVDFIDEFAHVRNGDELAALKAVKGW